MKYELQYVSPHYQYTLELLADKLVTPERYGNVALAQVIEFPTLFEMPDVTA